MAGSIVRQSRSVGSAFDALREKVRRTLLEGQAKIERARVETYWQTGKLIHEYILKDKTRSDHYGTQLLAKLSKALDVDETLLNRTLKFYRSYPKISATWQESLSWSHYRELLTVHDEAARISLRDRAVKSKWKLCFAQPL